MAVILSPVPLRLAVRALLIWASDGIPLHFWLVRVKNSTKVLFSNIELCGPIGKHSRKNRQMSPGYYDFLPLQSI